MYGGTVIQYVYGGVSAEGSSSAPKNIIFMIGDGMGPNQVNMAHDHLGKNLHMENMPYKGTSETSSKNKKVTDSAAGGTAIACGIKTKNGVIGMDVVEVEGKNEFIPVENIREYLADKGKKTGLISTASITDATPASFGAHINDRKIGQNGRVYRKRLILSWAAVSMPSIPP